MRRVFLSVLCLCIIATVNTHGVRAESTTAPDILADTTPRIETAKDITDKSRITAQGFSRAWTMTVEAFRYYAEGGASATVSITAQESIGGIYILFDSEYSGWSIDDGKGSSYVQNDFYIHQYLDTAALFGDECKSLTLTFSEAGAKITEIYVLGRGACPDWVQRWEPTPSETDILLISAHSDDEHLFFAGILPYYTAKGRIVTVAYLTEHNDKHERRHERLNGLWTAGVRSYPLVLGINDSYSTDLEWAKRNLKSDGHSVDEVDSLLVELLRRTKPMVVFTHDFAGEYGHGQHMLLADSLTRALTASSDSEKYPESAAKYGAYDVPKTYYHLYKENAIRFDWDVPLDELGGKSPFEVSRKAFLCHTSQVDSKFYRWLFGETGVEVKAAVDITEHSPLEFGLYRSTVGLDSGIGDVFENLTPYSDEGKEVVDTTEVTEADTTPETLPETLPETTSDEVIEPVIIPVTDTAASPDDDSDGIGARVALFVADIAAVGVVCACMIVRPKKPKKK